MDLQYDARRLIENISSELSPKSHPKLALLINNSLEMFVSSFDLDGLINLADKPCTAWQMNSTIHQPILF